MMIISYPKWKSSNSRNEICFRAVINMPLRNLAGMQQIQAVTWSALMLPEQVIAHSSQNGSGSPKTFRNLLQVSLRGQASTFLPSCYVLLKHGFVDLSKNFHFCLKQSKFRKEVLSVSLLLCVGAIVEACRFQCEVLFFSY